MKNVSATLGQAAQITCQFLKQNSNITIIWLVNDREYSCDEPEILSDVTCSLNDTYSVLQIENTAVLGLGAHLVQCVLQQNIPQRFLDDPSFRTEFSKNNTMSTTLTVVGAGELCYVNKRPILHLST